MSRADENMLYDGIPVQADLISWLLLGIGGAVLIPIALANRARWLLVLATPLILAGVALRRTRLVLTVEPHTGIIKADVAWLGIHLLARRHPHTEIQKLEIKRVGGNSRERDSDTWYLHLRLQTATYILGKYDMQVEALQAKHHLDKLIQAQATPPDSRETRARAEAVVQEERESAQTHYRMGLAHLASGNKEGGRRAFQRALELADNPMLRRMCEQRLNELKQA